MSRVIRPHTGIKSTGFDKAFDIANIFIMICIFFIMLYPLYFVLAASFSDPYEVVQGNVTFAPVKFNVEAYTNVFRDARIWRGYRNTIIYTALGVVWNLFLTLPTAYAMSKKTLIGRTLFGIYFLIPMYFGGGLIPTYLVVKSLGLVGNPMVMIIIGGLSIYNMVVCRVFFESSIANEVFDSARIDGANDFRIFLQIALPLSKAIIAVQMLFYGVGRWNEYFTALIYLSKEKYMPLQLVLRGILLQNQTALSVAMGEIDPEKSAELMAAAAHRTHLAEAMKYSTIFVASLPLLVIYPFIQKYFAQGVMVGSLKG